MQKTDIEWTDYSSNPFKLRLEKTGVLVNACVKVSPGCKNCYAETLTRRYWPTLNGKFPGYTPALMKCGEMVVVQREIEKLLRFKPKPPFKNGVKPMVFVEDMSDFAGEFVKDELIDWLFNVAQSRSDVIFQLLTKRAVRVRDYVSRRYARPVPNVWLGFSAENGKEFDERYPAMASLALDGWTTFCSAEPLLGPIELVTWFSTSRRKNGRTPLDWMIVGGESGPGSRPFVLDWARDIVRNCKGYRVPVFVKQFGSAPHCDKLRISHKGDPLPRGDGFWKHLNNRKGSDMTEWPEDLRVREFPMHVLQTV